MGAVRIERCLITSIGLQEAAYCLIPIEGAQPGVEASQVFLNRNYS